MDDNVERLELAIGILEKAIRQKALPSMVRALSKLDQELAESREIRHNKIVHFLREAKDQKNEK